MASRRQTLRQPEPPDDTAGARWTADPGAPARRRPSPDLEPAYATPGHDAPWDTMPTRTAEMDHTVPYRPPDEGGPPEQIGQTRPDNLGPLSRGHHNAKTHGGFQLHHPRQGLYLWRIPTGYWYQVDHTGTRALGRERPAVLDIEPSTMENHFERLLAVA